MQPITNQDGGTAGMGAKDAPMPGDTMNGVSKPTNKGMGMEIGMNMVRASNGSTVSSIQPLVDGPND